MHKYWNKAVFYFAKKIIFALCSIEHKQFVPSYALLLTFWWALKTLQFQFCLNINHTPWCTCNLFDLQHFFGCFKIVLLFVCHHYFIFLHLQKYWSAYVDSLLYALFNRFLFVCSAQIQNFNLQNIASSLEWHNLSIDELIIIFLSVFMVLS